jgi:para-nitrobenzyl esterase
MSRRRAPDCIAPEAAHPLRSDTSWATALRAASRRLVLVYVTATLALACGDDAPPPKPILASPETLRSTSLGDVIGFESEAGAHVWRGLPFAQPPVGALRWRAPRPPQPWTGTREALAFGSPCIQFAGPGGAREDLEPDDVKGSEDCLYLNVFAPPSKPGAVPKGADRLPVMFWIHGGGNTIGDAHIYDASTLAVDQNVVVVTVHYRMGVLGWLYHEGLHGDDATLDDRSGNFGTLDTIAGLEWVRDHISAFGGDPTNVTIFGESAGGTNVFALLISPRAAGLFHRAIAQSGSGWTVPIATARNPVDATPPGHPRSSSELLYALLVQDGTVKDRAAAKAEVDEMSASAIARTLRGKTPEELLRPMAGTGFGGMYAWPGLIRDGVVLPDMDAREAFATGRYNAVPAIFGTNRDENKLFMAFGSDYVRRISIMPLWFKNERMYDLASEYGAKSWKARGADEPAEAISRAGRSRAWVYRFDWDEEGRFLWVDLSRLFGAAHAFELPFVFGTLNLGPATEYVFPDDSRPGARALADTMMDYWGRFARTGDPGGEGAAAPWPPWEAGAGRFIVFDTEADGGLRMATDTLTRERVVAGIAEDERFESDAERCEILGQLVVFGRNLTEERYRTVLDGACADVPLPVRG